MADEPATSTGDYRRRLARAAAASCALHMLLFGGLSVTRLDIEPESDDAAGAQATLEPKRASDFRLQVPKSSSGQRPAHEQPLSLAVRPPVDRPLEPRDRPPEQAVADRAAAAPEQTASVETTRPEFERSRPLDARAEAANTPPPARRSEIDPAEAEPKAEMAAAAAAAETAAPAATPASVTPRQLAPDGPRVARWRPREVALLERLTTRAPDQAALAARPADAAAAPPTASEAPDRQAADLPASPSAAPVAAVAAPTTVASPSPASPTAAEATRRQRGPVAAASRSSAPTDAAATDAVTAAASAGGPTTVARPRLDAGASAAAGRSPGRASSVANATSGAAAVPLASGGVAQPGQAPGGSSDLAAAAPTASAAGGRGRSGRPASALGSAGGARGDGSAAEAAGGTSAPAAAPTAIVAGSGGIGGARSGRGDLAGTAASGAGAGTARSPGRDSGGLATDAGGSGGVAVAAVPAATAGGGGGAGGGGTGGSGPAAASTARLGPALIDRGRGRLAGSSAISAPRDGGSSAAAADGEEEGLSVSPADVASLGAAGLRRPDAGDGPSGPRSPERIAAAALPSDGRVRDMAEAFVSRTPTAAGPVGGITDREDLDRARAMVDRGLEFLVRSQGEDGRWSLRRFAGVTAAEVPKLDSDTAATGLALLCFLGAGHDHFEGPHRDAVRRGLEFLGSVQKPDGDLFLPADDLSNSCAWLYSHGIASIAVCEAVGMTGDPRLEPIAERACRFIAASRHPTLGGWRYVPGTDADLSVSGWMLVALRAGDLAGVDTDPAALEGVRTLIAAAAGRDPTQFAYNPRNPSQRRSDLSRSCMTAVGSLMRLHTGARADDPGVVAAGRALAGATPSYGTRSQRIRDSYLWYYASQVLVHTGGDEWQRWYAGLVDTLEPAQAKDGPLAGSWDALGDPADRWGEYGGRVYVTALHLLSLEVPWRHLPTYETAPQR